MYISCVFGFAIRAGNSFDRETTPDSYMAEHKLKVDDTTDTELDDYARAHGCK